MLKNDKSEGSWKTLYTLFPFCWKRHTFSKKRTFYEYIFISNSLISTTMVKIAKFQADFKQQPQELNVYQHSNEQLKLLPQDAL